MYTFTNTHQKLLKYKVKYYELKFHVIQHFHLLKVIIQLNQVIKKIQIQCEKLYTGGKAAILKSQSWGRKGVMGV